MVAGLALLALAGCTAHVKVKGAFPDPLVKPVPITLGLVYHDGFKDYRYEQKGKGGSRYIIDLGEPQTRLFNRVVGGAFARVKYADAVNETDDPVDLWLRVTAKAVQFAKPSESMEEIYEVWLNYRFEFLAPDGQLLSDWSAPGYGKTESGRFKSNEAALTRATYTALRDAGAHFVLKLRRDNELDQYLSEREIDMHSWSSK